MLMRDDHEMDLTDADLKEQERIADAARRIYGDPIWRDHTCWKCNDGKKPCPQGARVGCGYPVARNH